MSGTDGKNTGSGLRATRPGAGGSPPLRATIAEPARPGIALRAEVGTAGRGGIAAPLRPPGPRPMPPKSKLPLIILFLVPVVAAGLWFFTRDDARLPALPTGGEAPAPSVPMAPAASPPTAAIPSVPSASADVPVVAGSAQPYKEAPKEPGGVEVPFKESLIYNELKPGPGQTPPQRVERLLPPPEEPMPKPAPAAETPTPPASAPSVASTPVANDTPAPTVAGAPDASGAIAVGEAALPQSVPQAKDELAQAPAPATSSGVLGTLPVTPGAPEAEALKADEDVTQAPADTESTGPAASTAGEPGSLEDVFQRLSTPGAPPPPKTGGQTAAAPTAPPAALPAAGGEFRIQLASVRTQAEAQAEWKRLQGRYPNELGRLTPVFTSASLPQGTFIRVQAGPLSEADARARCAALTGQPGVSGCRAVRVSGTP